MNGNVCSLREIPSCTNPICDCAEAAENRKRHPEIVEMFAVSCDHVKPNGVPCLELFEIDHQPRGDEKLYCERHKR